MLLKALKALYPNASEETLIRTVKKLCLDESSGHVEFEAWIHGLLTGYIIAESINEKTNDNTEET